MNEDDACSHVFELLEEETVWCVLCGMYWEKRVKKEMPWSAFPPVWWNAYRHVYQELRR